MNFASELKKRNPGRTLTVMEVCGTHTMSIARHGIRSLLPSWLKLISGPGCPVCVTSAGDIAAALELAKKENTLIVTFGDMLKVPARGRTLSEEKNVKIIYSPLEALTLAKNHPDKEIIFLGIGFETTAPLIGATIKKAKEEKLKNFSVLCLHKTVPAALTAIMSDKTCAVDALLLPGHVSAITGRRYYQFMEKIGATGVIAGFEADEILSSLLIITDLVMDKKSGVVNNYPRAVNEEGNKMALAILSEVFEPCDVEWRGIGVIPGSGLAIRKEFSAFDASKKFSLKKEIINDGPGCLCGNILMGKSSPKDCPHFGKSCTPTNAIGPCMVSSEGTCAAWYKYGVKE